ncbi:hypothetical protein BJ322DRAFT_464708 [Thelephora terrestris]|uniref:F-box domain-containing protein n=1 Tax=Thelephora terrestris TaxID=56493 RepID=A0A9P6L1W6_9AGAM|nr:hypothetical protein BJ322DRAFT_464708 [Thelephora terrestris]
MPLGPKSRVSSSESTSCTDSGYAQSDFRKRDSSPFPFFTSLQSVLRLPRILGCLLSFIPYEDFNALTSSCTEFRKLMEKPALKDTILSCFLPGFRSLLRFKNPELFVDVHVTIGDLNTFHLSNKTGLHSYPVHALQFGFEFEDAHRSHLLHKLQRFTTAHSKFVLLLQSLAHSSVKPLQPELEDASHPRPNPPISLPLGIRHLYLPEPLCYEDSPAIQRTPSYQRQKRSQSAEVVTGQSKPSAKRISFLTRAKRPPPPPSADFIIRQSYFSPWRRILESSSHKTPDPPSPRRRRFNGASSWSDTSISTSTRLSMIQERPGRKSVSRIRIPFQSTHDIQLATSRVHAPVLRVFVPCSELNDVSIAACEDQLADAGLWDHLSTGDIVCNLGYMPPPPLSDEDPDHDPVVATSASVSSRPSSLGNGMPSDDLVWLVYDGVGLVRYSPTIEPPPLKDPFTLVTPHYYSHILPSSAHPFFTLDVYSRLSRFREETTSCSPSTLKLGLIAMTTKVKSPTLPGGYALVKRYRWVATIKGIRAALPGNVEVGSGWLTNEWALEVDGTFEGRKMLEHLISPLGARAAGAWAQGDWVWEVDRQRSNSTVTWFRLLRSSGVYSLPLEPTTPGPVSAISVASPSMGSPGLATGNQRRFSFMAR